MRRELPDALDLLTISVEAGLAFDAGLAQVARNTTGPLAAGVLPRAAGDADRHRPRPRPCARSASAPTCPSCASFVGAMVQADAFGIPIAGVLRVQAKEMRVKRSQRAEELAQKVPVKILFPLIFCILPVPVPRGHGAGGHHRDPELHRQALTVARLLVVSRSMALAMRIADDHDVVEYPVEGLEELAPGPDVEAVVLDLGEPARRCRPSTGCARAATTPACSSSRATSRRGTTSSALPIERVVVVPLPITRAALLDGIDRLLGRDPEPGARGLRPGPSPVGSAGHTCTSTGPGHPARGPLPRLRERRGERLGRRRGARRGPGRGPAAPGPGALADGHVSGQRRAG